MTPMKEDYLKIIFELGGTKNKISNKQIALSLNVAAGSVTEMVSKLVKEGLASHTPYAGISLTDEGIELAEQLVRRHRLWEVFLFGKLKYKLADVHDDAEILEHTTSDRLMDHLDRFLDYPTHCPHGGVIPSADGRYEEDSHTVLADIADGQSVVVERFIDNHDLLTYLDDLKLKIGEELTIIEHTPFEGPVKIRLHKTKQEINVSFKAAHYIFVK
ncbi:MAG: metal-dependent transcriptional regulator [Liquorilactobacillus nagelii]|jgi:DtxR family Mn-dependent transcriptional regulator|uniref:Manganese transport regulator n=1 Tax=Liquorilactobacillus nagelii TaxID=82688 RepID=A0A3Q8CB13_9LACO|nr:metal-dependent transcriptional regulator [Liquorilactobacillus nagelii]AUJ31286.1 Cro/Cl family transcriptional regulator [Liquorilactobacillus nagelii]KRL40322.1 Iron-dependent repressor [Liquorilactobacillus nagelii DSM 13675]MCC7616150.1 metal-dependent transcriptional regulator [Liquorilactobacillus nagelii]MCI1699231.1 metal-dependent transcriptional regulator [Liquorilactobacillus nagelii]MCP9315040.1 metal-dependent transcriptional regulator [Liquorilactobacillus nagelii]